MSTPKILAAREKNLWYDNKCGLRKFLRMRTASTGHAHSTLPWLPEVFLACGGNFPKADTENSRYKDLTETGNRARKVSGTQGNSTLNETSFENHSVSTTNLVGGSIKELVGDRKSPSPSSHFSFALRDPRGVCVCGGGGGVLGLIFAGYVPLAFQSPYPIIIYFLANFRPHLSHNFRDPNSVTFYLCIYLINVVSSGGM